MIKVLIVEDEAGIRNALLADYDWAALGCSVSSAASGIEAIELCIQSAPDIVITDIVIPGIDGITLLKYLKFKRTDALFIVMTGHRDFEYAQNSLNLGAFAFLLKPIQHDEFLTVVSRAIDALMQRDGAGSENSQEQALVHALSGFPMNLERAPDSMRQALQSSTHFYVALAEFDSAEHRNAEDLKNLYHFCKNALTANQAFAARMDNFRLSLLLPFAKEQTSEALRSYLLALQRSITRAYKFTVSFGVSRQTDDLQRLGDCYTEAAKMLGLRFFSGSDSINCFSEPAGSGVASDAESRLDTYQIVLLSESIANRILSGNPDRIYEDIHFFTSKLAAICEHNEILFRSSLLCIITLCLKQILKENKRQFSLVMKKYSCFQQIVESSTLANIEDMLLSLAIDLSEYTSTRGSVKRKAILQRITNYIEEHYAEEVSLSSLAQVVYLSPSYLSTLISCETGNSFVGILNEYRIQKAMELMQNATLKNMAIAEKVGFKEPQYFSHVFRKYVGLSPTEYRQLHPPAKD